MDFQAIWDEAQAAAQVAALAKNNSLGDENKRGFDCGFAWISFKGNSAFAKWAKKEGLTSPGYPSGVHIWYSRVHNVPTQSYSVHEAACRAAGNVLNKHLGSGFCHVGTRLD